MGGFCERSILHPVCCLNKKFQELNWNIKGLLSSVVNVAHPRVMVFWQMRERLHRQILHPLCLSLLCTGYLTGCTAASIHSESNPSDRRELFNSCLILKSCFDIISVSLSLSKRELKSETEWMQQQTFILRHSLLHFYLQLQSRLKPMHCVNNCALSEQKGACQNKYSTSNNTLTLP